MMEYTFIHEPCGPLYRALIEHATYRCTRMTLVTRHSMQLSSRGNGVLQELSPFLNTAIETDHWPGTQLLGHTASLSQYTFGEAQASILMQMADSLYSWLQPELPEDLCLYRADGTVWLTTISHEQDAFLCLSPRETEELKSIAPDLFAIIAL